MTLITDVRETCRIAARFLLYRIYANFAIRPQDQAKLELEYNLNPKPNKAARAEIVKSVSLNEKEVQVRTP